MSGGILPCAVVRVGLWSGGHYGGCLAIAVRVGDVGFDFLETQATAGGAIPSFDLVVSPASALVPLVNDGSWQRLYLRVGVQAGYSWATTSAGHDFFRFGGHVGIGYELTIASSIALRLLDLRVVAEVTGNDADRVGHAFDPGVTASSGVVF